MIVNNKNCNQIINQKTIVFDLHDVLFNRNYYESFKRIVAIKGKLRLLFIIVHPKFMYDAFKMLSVTRVCEAYIVKLCQQYPALRPYMQSSIELMNALSPNLSVFELIQKLKKNGNKIYILSNIGPSTLQDLAYHHQDLFTYFDGIHCVEAANSWIAKPHPHAYNLFLKKFNIDPGHMIFIDDKPKNVIAALQLGIDAILYRSKEQLYKRMLFKKIII